MDNDTRNSPFGEGALNPEAAETGFVDKVIRSAGIVFVKVLI